MARPRKVPAQSGRRRRNDIQYPARKAVLYARVSTPEQEREGYSIPAQVKLLQDYAAVHAIEIVKSHIDIETARKMGRTAFGEMLRYLRGHPEVRILLVEKTDRLYRNLKDWAIIDDLGIEVHLVKENVVMSDDCRSSEKFVHGIKVLMAKAYIDNLSEEASKGMLEKARQGIWPSCAPIGYRNVADQKGRKVIVVDPDLGPLVTRMFEWFSTGDYSLKTVAAKAHTAGLRYRKSGKRVVISTINKILRSRIYTGSFEWLGVTYEGSHEPLVSFPLWQIVQDVLDERSHTNVRSPTEDFPFRGLLQCGRCGCALVAEIKKSRYIYYHCTDYRGKCPEPYVRQELLEEQLIALLRGLHCSAERLATVREAIEGVGVGEGPVGEEAAPSSRWEKARRRQEGAGLARDGIALLDMAATAHLRLPGMPANSKRQLLSLLFARCSWAHGCITATFNTPFDVLENLASRNLSREVNSDAVAPLVALLLRPNAETKLLIARHNAMMRLRDSKTQTGAGRDKILTVDHSLGPLS